MYFRIEFDFEMKFFICFQILFVIFQLEVIVFFGCMFCILNDLEEFVYIIMECMIGKIMDVYVEFCIFEDVFKVVEKYQCNYCEGWFSYIGQRVVIVSLVSQVELMEDFFFFVVGFKWKGVNFEFDLLNDFEFWKNFKGFVFEEEMIMLVKYVKVFNCVCVLFKVVLY